MGQREKCNNKCTIYRTDKRSEKNSKGFAVTALLIFLPLIFAIFIFLYVLHSHIEIQSDFNNICRTYLTKTQQTVHYELEILMALNKIIGVTNFLKVTTLVLLPALLILFPAFAIIASKFIHYITKIQNGIAKYQRFLIELMRETMRIGNLQTKYKIYSDFYNYKLSLFSFLNFSDFKLKYVTTPEPAVEPVNANVSPTIYRFKKEFENKQKLYFSWSFTSTTGWRFNSQSLKMVNPMRNFSHKIKGSCIISLTEEYPWNPIPIMVKL